MQTVEDVKNAILEHFGNFFKERNLSRPVPEELNFNRLMEYDKDMLEEPFS